MNVRLISATFALAFPMVSYASYSGSCGGDYTDASGYQGTCSCDERPQCDNEGECECEYDDYCADTSCGSSAAVDPVIGRSSVRAWTPRQALTEAAR